MSGQASPAQHVAACPCVVLIGRRYGEPAELLRGLRARGAAVSAVRNAAQAIVALVRDRNGALIVDEPGSVRGVNELLTTVRRCFPAVVCWRYDATAGGLRKFEAGRDVRVQKEAAPDEGNAASSDVPSPASPPDKTRHPLPDVRPGGLTGRGSEPLVSREELEMLLGEPGAGAATESSERG